MQSFLLCGLGNIGEQYARTRHNVGFVIVDHLAMELGLQWQADTMVWRAQGQFKGRKLQLIKPKTFMNLSGRAVQYWLTKLALPMSQVLVIVDDLHLPFLQLRYRARGSSGGHNGLKDIEASLGSQDYPRLRVGIGNNFAKGRQVEFVLAEWSSAEWQQLKQSLPQICEKLRAYISYPQDTNIFHV